MRKASALLLCALAAACQQPAREIAVPPARPKVKTVIIPEDEKGKRRVDEARIAPTLIDKLLLGTRLGPDFNVAADSASVPEGQPLYLTVRLKDSPAGLRIGVIWKDAHGKKIAVEEKEMNGSKAATFTLPQKLAPGRYSVESYWGATPGIAKQFEVTGKKK
ncbi:MAG: hypothetical protein QOE82_1382 [Thermoanaerobaculia bacterium]|jgi:hypothetical protein|nr:hypothetical protein [Thermoanaerobaculia bacterium]